MRLAAGRGPNPTESHGMPARGVVERARFMGRESLVELKMDLAEKDIELSEARRP